MELRIDHVTVAASALEPLVDAFETAGLGTAYGGTHSNGVTHMSLLGFRDGSYVELVSTVEPGADSPWWDEPIRRDGGPCAWAIGVEDIDAATATLEDRGVDTDGPTAYRRVTDDGTVVEWDLTSLGDGDPGSTLPFLISDRTPRERRASPTGEMASSPIVGVDTVVVGVADPDAAASRFETAFDLAEPTRGELVGPTSGGDAVADVAVFEDAPVALARPRGPGALADRIDSFGPLPFAYVLGCEALEGRSEDLAAGSLAGRTVGWMPVSDPVGYRYLGLAEPTG